MTRDEFIRRFDFAVRDLPWRTKRELVADLESHLAEIPPDIDLAERIGTPEQYASDMRDAAELEHRRGVVAYVRARRPRTVVLTTIATVVLVLVVGFLIAAVAWVDSYQPLAFGNGAQDTPGAKLDLGDSGEHVALRQGRPFEVGLSVVNYGRFTVRVLGITGERGLSFADLPLSNRRLTVSGPRPNDGGFAGPFRLFHPFDLKPGELMLIKLTGTYDARCRPSRVGTQYFWSFSGFQVRYGFLWRTGTAQIETPSGNLSIQGPKNEICSLPKR